MLRRFLERRRPTPPDRVSFAVDDVTPAKKQLWSEPLARSLVRRYCREILVLPEAEKPVVNSMMDSIPPQERSKLPREAASRCHPLIDAVQTAFSQHYPLTLSPDAIWLAIAQGFSHHITKHASIFRDRLVRHTGRATLTAQVNDLSLSSFESAIAQFSSQIRDASDPVLHETLLCDFSTTTPAIRTASEVVLMDTYASYFEYMMMCVCGIPRITVRGSVADWERVRARIEVLETFHLGWWVERLRPILDEFIQTVRGTPNVEFWRAIYKPKDAYASTAVTGWIADLFPYLNDAPRRTRNHVFDTPRINWAIPVPQGVETRGAFFTGGGVNTKSFPSGLSSVPVKLTLADGSTSGLDLVAGYLAVEQAADDLSLSPVISWSVTQPSPEKPVLVW